jgi:flagellar biogenesis protein FliO
MKVEVISSRAPRTTPGLPAFLDWFERARAVWRRVLQLRRRPARRLRLCESLPLGERRFVAVVEFENSRFLLGGTSASLVLLAQLEDTDAEETPILQPKDEHR